MGEIFRRFSYWGYFMALVITVYEISRYKAMQIDKIAILSALGSVGTLLLFSAVYTRKSSNTKEWRRGDNAGEFRIAPQSKRNRF